MKHTSKTIADALHQKYINNCKYKVPNAYIFKTGWESDFFIQRDNGYCYEFEIKISRADFKKDFEKVVKHQILKDGTFKTSKGQIKEWPKRPNKFYYVIPTGIIDFTEIPKYAGLMTIDDNGNLKTVKEAPFLHKNILDLEKELCVKFYYYWLKERQDRIWTDQENQKLFKKVELLQSQIQELKATKPK